MRMIRNTVTWQVSSSFIPTSNMREERPPSPSTSQEVLVETFPDMCFMTDKYFGVLWECIERESLVIYEILALPNYKLRL